MTVRVLVVSDVRVVQEGLNLALAQRDDVEVLSTSDAQHAMEYTARLQPDVVLVDAAHADDTQFVQSVVACSPHARVVAFGVKETAQEVLALAAAGTAGYVRDSAPSADIARTLTRLMCGELLCSARAAASLYRRVATLSRRRRQRAAAGGKGYPHEPSITLSRREIQIAQLLDCGLSNKQIARRLGIEVATVKNHVHNLCEKLQVHRRGEAAARVRALAGAAVAAETAATDTARLVTPQ
jgi:two-component system nitrate/nitrite response regulator NarL